MKILCIHADHIEYQATKKALKSAEEVDKDKVHVKDCLVIFSAVEKRDEEDLQVVSEKLVHEIADIARQVKAETVVLYPYAHLSSDLSSPDAAIDVLKKAEILLSKDYKVFRAPFGWYKSFEIKAKGHPLSELSREFSVHEIERKKKGEEAAFADVKSDKKTAEESKEETKHVFVMEKKKLSDEQQIHFTTALIAAHAIVSKHKGSVGYIGMKGDVAFIDLAGVKVTQDMIPGIEKDMKELIKKEHEITKLAVKDVHDSLQKEVLADLKKEGHVFALEGTSVVPLYVDPFLDSTKSIKSFKIVELGGAYWRNNAQNKQLSRVYIVGFTSEEGLKDFEKIRQEAQLRDHRVIGKQLDLFSMQEEAPGMPFFHNKGNRVYTKLIEYMTEELSKLHYELNRTPIILNKRLWLMSGHWDHYKENMYFTKIDNQDFAVKPMNCPGNLLIYKANVHSYKELPIKAGEYGLVHRHELSGVLSGLFRVRVFTQDDAHIFCADEQLEDQIIELIDLVDRVYKTFGFTYAVELSTKPDHAMGDPKKWILAEESLAKAMKHKHMAFKINPGDGAFYGPKLDFHIKDAIGRSWQCGTIQVDFSMPEKFDLTYEGSDSKKHRPVMLHRAIYGSVERFMGILIEHFAGKFPLWLNPVQVKIVTITDRNIPFARDLAAKMIVEDLRVEIDERAETMGKKVREAQMEKVNYIITIGDKEMEQNVLAIRTRNGEVKYGVKVDEFISELKEEVKSRKIV